MTRVQRFCVQGPSNSLEVEVQFAGCLSSTCDTLEYSECTLTDSNGVVAIEGFAEIRRESYGSCSTDCGAALANCSIELPPGEYTLEHAEQNLQLTLPTTREVCSENR